MAVPPPGEEERDPVPAADEVTVSMKPLYYGLCGLCLVMVCFALDMYARREDTVSLGILVYFVLALGLVPVLLLRFPSRAATERRIPGTDLRMRRISLFLLWAACGVMLLVGGQDLLSSHLPWPVHVLQMAALVPLALSVEAYVRDRRKKS